MTTLIPDEDAANEQLWSKRLHRQAVTDALHERGDVGVTLRIDTTAGFYFRREIVGTFATYWVSPPIVVEDVRDLTVDQWLVRYDRLVGRLPLEVRTPKQYKRIAPN